MKKLFNMIKDSLKDEPRYFRVLMWSILAFFLFLIAWCIGVIAVTIARNIQIIAGLLVLFFLCGGEALVSFWKNRKRRSDQTCAGCGGCANYYPAIRSVMFTVLRQSASALSFHPPATEEAIISSVQQVADGMPRFSFKVFKQPDAQTPISNDVLVSCLQSAINDACAAYCQSFTGSKMQGLYIENIREQNAFTYVISIIPVCPPTLPFLQTLENRKLARANQTNAVAETDVYDEEF